MHNPADELTLDRTSFSIISFGGGSLEDDERAYWWSCTPQERMRQLEYLRQMNYGDQAGERLQRILEVVELAPR